jgi:hypothetical protein
MAPLRWVWNTYFSGIILRRERDDLRESIDRAREIYPNCCPGALWVETRKRFEFPTGATIQYGEMTYEESVNQYKTFEYSFIGFDELTTFLRSQYVYMLSRNRSKKVAGLPLHMRAGTNPDGPGHEWVFKRFVQDREPGKIYSYPYELVDPDGRIIETEITRQFLPATAFDNPHADNLDEYMAGLRAMGKDLSDALLYGRWDFFRGQMFPYAVEEVDPELKSPRHFTVRCMDYGWTNPSVIYWLVVYPRPDGLPIVEVAEELYVKETSIDGMAHLIKHRERQLMSIDRLDSATLSVIDPSAAKSEGTSGGQNVQEMLQHKGVWFDRANNDRQSGWAALRDLLEAGRLRFWKGRCPYLLSTLPKLVRDPAKADDIKAKQDDHGADALRYGVQAVTLLGPDVPAPEHRETEREALARSQDIGFERYLEELQSDRDQSSLEDSGGW